MSLGFGEAVGGFGERRLVDALSGFDGGDAECRREVGLSGSGRSEEVDGFASPDEVELGQGGDSLAVERGLECEVEAFDRLDGEELRGSQRDVYPSCFAQGAIFAQDGVDGFDGSGLALLEAPQRGSERFERPGHFQSDQGGADAVDEFGHRAAPCRSRRRRAGVASARGRVRPPRPGPKCGKENSCLRLRPRHRTRNQILTFLIEIAELFGTLPTVFMENTMTLRALASASLVLLCAVAPAISETVTIDLWSRADRSGPLRAGNIVAAADQLNRMFEAAGSETRVEVNLIETNAKGFDADALDLLKAHSVGDAPDIAVAAHEWIGSFVEAGFAANLEEHIEASPWFYADIIPELWSSVMYKGERYGIPQDSEIRMFFLNNDILRAGGKSEDFIAGLPAAVDAGEFTMFDFCDLAAEMVDAGAAKVGWVHRPNVGPDFQMAMASFGIDVYNEDEAKLQITKSGLEDYYGWLKYCVDNGSLPADMTSYSWDSTHAAFRGGDALSKFHGIWNVGAQLEAFGLTGPEEYFDKLTWIHAPAGEKGGEPKNLSHPIVYIVGDTENKELAATLVGMASLPVPNTAHAVGTNHTPITFGQVSMPEFQENGWALVAGTPLLSRAEFMPNHAKIGQYNAITYTGVQAVETGEMSPQDAAEMVIEELEIELGDDVIILD